jgi:hypothetical protein
MKTVQFARGTATQNNAFTGAVAQVTVDTTNNTLRVHDGTTPGGHATLSRFAASTVGYNVFTLGNPSAVTFLRVNADNTVSTLSASDFRAAIGAGSGTGDVTLVGTQTLTNKTIEAGTFTNGYIEETVAANTGSAYTIDFANGTVQILTLTANCSFTFPTPIAGKSFTILLKQDGTGSRTATWPSSVKWPSNTAPTITSTASKMDKLVFTADGSNWIASVAGQNYTV